MSILLSGISVPIDGNEADIKTAAAGKLGLPAVDIERLRVKKQSVDSRKKEIRFVYTLDITLFDKDRQQVLEGRFGSAGAYQLPDIAYGDRDPLRPVIIGAGPCGLFAALTLSAHGYRPLILDRGGSVAQREQHVDDLIQNGVLNEESNVCFGAGGAGAFSDGKLTTRIKDPRAEFVLETLVRFGAPAEILYIAKPHTGTEYIRKAVDNLIGHIVSLGADVRFGSRLTNLSVSHGALCGLAYATDGRIDKAETRAVILAIGHSARDTYDMLLDAGVAITPKPFAIGLRIEHKREFIDRSQYGEYFAHPALGAAEYRLKSRQPRGVYTFCMCPGGEVICSATEPDELAVNGMSGYKRDGENSNSAVVVGVGEADFPPGALGGVAFQRAFERAAYSEGFGAPVQLLGDFMQGRLSRQFGHIAPSYRPFTVFKNLEDCLPRFAGPALKKGLKDFGTQISGFDMPEAVLTGVETRTSAPVRLLRKADFQSIGIEGLFPAGEGAGYAGGIVSAAVDGIKCAEALMRIFSPPK